MNHTRHSKASQTYHNILHLRNLPRCHDMWSSQETSTWNEWRGRVWTRILTITEEHNGINKSQPRHWKMWITVAASWSVEADLQWPGCHHVNRHHRLDILRHQPEARTQAMNVEHVFYCDCWLTMLRRRRTSSRWRRLQKKRRARWLADTKQSLLTLIWLVYMYMYMMV